MSRKAPHTKHAPESPVAVKLEASLKVRLEQLSEAKDRSTHWLMKQAIEQYVLAEEEALRLKQETLRRWEKEALLNDTVANADVMRWLDTWGDEGATPPEWK